jgi:hypothetical protein
LKTQVAMHNIQRQGFATKYFRQFAGCLFKLLNHNAADERMLTVMQQVMPAEIMEFLTPKRDIYNALVYLSGEQAFEADKLPARGEVDSLMPEIPEGVCLSAVNKH